MVLSLICATLVAGVGIASRINDGGSNGRLEATIIKAGAPVTATTEGSNPIHADPFVPFTLLKLL